MLGTSTAQAQLTPDTTLESQNSRVNSTTVNGSSAEVIEGGVQRESNLFHSFSDFNVGAGQQVYFANPNGIERIFNRVTGGNTSDILGTLGVLGNADLFLLNPNGVIFGPNARLDVGGSLIVTSADSFVFENDFSFSAQAPQAPPLLTVNVPTGLQMGPQPGALINQSTTGLEVAPQQTLAFIGGDLLFEGSVLQAPGGQIDLVGLGDNAFIGLSANGLGYGLDAISNQSVRPVTFRDGARAIVSGEGAGNLQIQGSRLDMTDGSALVANTLGATDGGEVILTTAEAVGLSGTLPSGETGGVFLRALDAGDAANLTINTGTLTIDSGAKISAATFAAGRAGDVTLNATEAVNLMGTLGSGNEPSAIFADTEGTGAGGNITINTGRLRVQQGGNIGVSSGGSGLVGGGNLVVNASEFVEIDGEITTPDFSIPSALTAFTLGQADGGRIILNTPQVFLTNGGVISTATLGSGRGGDVVITAPEAVKINGTDSLGFSSFIVARSFDQSSGDAGNITITTGRLQLLQGGEIIAGAFGSGNAGNITINASELIELSQPSPDGQLNSFLSNQTRGIGNAGSMNLTTPRLVLRDGGQIVNTTLGEGDGGLININAQDIEISGRLSAERFASGLFSEVASSGTGQGGIINIQAERLRIEEGGLISASTRGDGDSGSLHLFIQDSILVQGSFPDTEFNSRITVQTDPTATGDGGNLLIETGQLSVLEGAEVSASTFSVGDAGNITIRATDSVEIRGDEPTLIAVDSLSGATGDAGNLTVQTPRLTLQGQAGLLVGSFNSTAGDLKVTANSIALLDGASFSAATRGVAGGNIVINEATMLVLSNRSEIVAQAENDANGGNITINAEDGFLVAFPNENSDIVASAERGNGGNITINALGIFGLTINSSPERAPFSEINASSETGIDGTITINNPAVNLQTLPELPVTFSAPPLAQGCGAGASESRFTNLGRGGVPANPTDPLTPAPLWYDFLDLQAEPRNSPTQFQPESEDQLSTNSAAESDNSTNLLREAQGWVRQADGSVSLVTDAPTVTPNPLGRLVCLSES